MYFRHTEVAAASAAAVAPSELTRRQFLRLTTLAGSGLTLGILLPGCGTGPGGAGSSAGAASGPLAMPFLRIAPDNTVTVISKHLEAGQGVWTGLPAIVAEELDASWDQMRVESAPAKVPLYRNLAFVPLGASVQLLRDDGRKPGPDALACLQVFADHGNGVVGCDAQERHRQRP